MEHLNWLPFVNHSVLPGTKSDYGGLCHVLPHSSASGKIRKRGSASSRIQHPTREIFPYFMTTVRGFVEASSLKLRPRIYKTLWSIHHQPNSKASTSIKDTE
jgi:hypothetical protein